MLLIMLSKLLNELLNKLPIELAILLLAIGFNGDPKDQMHLTDENLDLLSELFSRLSRGGWITALLMESSLLASGTRLRFQMHDIVSLTVRLVHRAGPISVGWSACSAGESSSRTVVGGG